jgi:hypothetical protein
MGVGTDPASSTNLVRKQETEGEVQEVEKLISADREGRSGCWWR